MIEDKATDFMRKYPDEVIAYIMLEMGETLDRTERLLSGAVPVETGNMRDAVMSTIVYDNKDTIAGQTVFNRDKFSKDDFYPAFLEFGTEHITEHEFVKETAQEVRSEFNQAMKGVGKAALTRTRRKARTKRG